MPVSPLPVIAAATSFILASCGSIAGIGPGAADTTYTLEIRQNPEYPEEGPVIFLDAPVMEQGLGGRSVTVALPGHERAALRGVSWSDNLSSLIRGYLVRALRSDTRAQVIGEGGLDVSAACRMSISVWAFQLRPGRAKSDDIVEAEFETSLVRLFDGRLLGRQNFSRTMMVADGNIGVAVAFNQAMSQVSTDIGSWLAERSGQCITRSDIEDELS